MGDICCLSNCLGARLPEHDLNGICKNGDVNLWDNDPNYCGGDSDDGGGGGGGGDSDDDNDQTTASSSATVTNASKLTVTPSTPSNVATHTTLPTQTPNSNPAGSSSPSASSSIRVANMIALGLLVVILTAGIEGAGRLTGYSGDKRRDQMWVGMYSY